MVNLQTSALHVLLLEDDPAIARTMCYALQLEGMPSYAAFDVMLMDAGLPDDNGLDEGLALQTPSPRPRFSAPGRRAAQGTGT